MIDPAAIRDRFSVLSRHLNERDRRLLAAAEAAAAAAAAAAGYGGIGAMSQATGIAASTIGRGLKELAVETVVVAGRIAAGGRRAQAADGHRPWFSGRSDGLD